MRIFSDHIHDCPAGKMMCVYHTLCNANLPVGPDPRCGASQRDASALAFVTVGIRENSDPRTLMHRPLVVLV